MPVPAKTLPEGTILSQRANRRRKRRFGRNQSVDAATGRRTAARLKALGGSVAGVDASDGFTGRESRLAKRARDRQKSSRITYSTEPVHSSSSSSTSSTSGQRKAPASVAVRTINRLNALGGSGGGVTLADQRGGFTRQQTRKVKKARRLQKASRWRADARRRYEQAKAAGTLPPGV